MTAEETEQMVVEAVERWRNPPPLTEKEKRRSRAAEALAELLDDDD